MRKGLSVFLALGLILALTACGNTNNESALATEAVTTVAPTTVEPTTVVPSTVAPTTEPATEKTKAASPIDMLGLSFDEILQRYGNDYTEVDEPGSGLTKCICYPNTGNPYEFGIDFQSQCVSVIYVYDINDDPIVLFDDITNRTKLSEMSDARAKYPNTISNGPLIDNIKQSVSFTYRDGILVNFDWINNDVSDKADRVMIIDTNGTESSSGTQPPVENKSANENKQSSNTQSSFSEKPKETWKKLYAEYLQSAETQAFSYAGLIYLNDDEIPEMVIRANFSMRGTMLCWIKQDAVESQGLGRLGKTSYGEHSGVIVQDSLYSGLQAKSIFSFDGILANQLHFGEQTPTGVFRWDSNEISEAEYNANIAAYEGYSEVSFITKDEMISAL